MDTTSQTQKIGNTRIIVENMNGEMKSQICWLNCLIPTLQFSIVSKIVLMGYLLQIVKKAIIQNRDPSKPTPSGCHPCRAEKRWYGATDTDLRVVRSNIRLWGVKSEIARHAELSKMPEHASKSATKISEMVLDDQWDLKKREELYHDVHGYEYVEK